MLAKSVLIVEDTLTQALMLEHLLKGAGFSCTVARSAAKAIELVTSGQTFDVVLSDINMPECNGFQLCTALKQMDLGRQLPFVLLVSLADTDEILSALECGADNIILKEFNSKYFLPRLNEILEASVDRQQKTANGSDDGCSPLTMQVQQLKDMLLSTYAIALQQKHGQRDTAEVRA